jgi:hypothetical protein
MTCALESRCWMSSSSAPAVSYRVTSDIPSQRYSLVFSAGMRNWVCCQWTRRSHGWAARWSDSLREMESSWSGAIRP